MKRLVKLPTLLERANVVPGTPPVTRARSSSSQGVRARTAIHLSRRQALILDVFVTTR
jgi:hypothetical protein